jgi:Ca2+-binding EF-hand superfamily protein
LIAQSDILELIEKFESSDVNHDYGISNDEFLKMLREDNCKQFGDAIDMTTDEIECANLRFRLIDSDKNGHIDWDEYLDYECMRRLHRVPLVFFF